jgi:hypothetical protein
MFAWVSNVNYRRVAFGAHRDRGTALFEDAASGRD